MPVKRLSLVLSAIPLLILAVLVCAKPRIDRKTEISTEPPASYKLFVGAGLENYFTDIQKKFYSEDELPALWQAMSGKSAIFCREFRKGGLSNGPAADSFLKPEFQSIIRKDYRTRREFFAVILGCRNYYQLNDVRPDHDFMVVKDMFPEEKFDCFTVGYMQAYVLSSILPCQRISIMDIDWQILRGHYELERALRQNPQNADLKGFLANVKLRSIAHHPTEATGGEEAASLKNLCFDEQEFLCRDTIEAIRKNPAILSRIELQLTHLKDTDFHKGSGLKRLIYFSNALEWLYTNKEEFEHLMQNLKDSLLPDQSAIAIFHMGGRYAYGIYEIRKKADILQVEARCRDVYIPNSKDAKPIQIHLDYLVKNRAPSCAAKFAGVSRRLTAKNKPAKK